MQVQSSKWVPVTSDHALHGDGFRWMRLDDKGEPEMFATHAPEAIVAGMCRAAGFPTIEIAGNN